MDEIYVKIGLYEFYQNRCTEEELYRVLLDAAGNKLSVYNALVGLDDHLAERFKDWCANGQPAMTIYLHDDAPFNYKPKPKLLDTFSTSDLGVTHNVSTIDPKWHELSINVDDQIFKLDRKGVLQPEPKTYSLRELLRE